MIRRQRKDAKTQRRKKVHCDWAAILKLREAWTEWTKWTGWTNVLGAVPDFNNPPCAFASLRLCVNFFFFLFLSVGILRAAETKPLSTVFEEANQAYARGDWDAAIKGYESLTERDAADPALYYNLGTAYARNGEKGRAVWMLLKALRENPRHRSARENLQMLAPDAESQNALFPLWPLQIVYASLALNEWAALAALMTLSGCAVASMAFMAQRASKRRAAGIRLTWILLSLALISHALAICKYREERYSSRGVVVAADVRPHEAPSDESAAADFILPPGTVVAIENAGVEGWVKAVYGGRQEVFIRRDQMEFL